MSVLPTVDPVCSQGIETSAIATVIDARPRDIGGFAVGRVLPSAARRLVGPFVFFDHMGPAGLAPGQGLDVRPHPHIGLATVTYLFDGEIVHCDSLGTHQPIRPGDVNWMTAGRGIVHSERTPQELRRAGSRLHGLQLWVALPLGDEETKPAFHHHSAGSLPLLELSGARIRILAGSAYGERSPVETFSSLFYAEATMPAGCGVAVPGEHEERAVYVVAACWCSQTAQRSVYTRPSRRASCCSAASRSRANGTFGGILSRARGSGSSRLNGSGRKAASQRSPATRPSSFRYRTKQKREAPERLRVPPSTS
jgi:redox-sensitive bicupin YhaK (pirin superfamily)